MGFLALNCQIYPEGLMSYYTSLHVYMATQCCIKTSRCRQRRRRTKCRYKIVWQL